MNSREQILHQKYLAHVIETVGWRTLANTDPRASDVDAAPLEEVYVELMTDFRLRVEVEDAKITDWWVSSADREGSGSDSCTMWPDNAPVEHRTYLSTLGSQDAGGVRALVAQAQNDFQARRANAEKTRAESKTYGNYNDIKDGVHTAVPSLSIGYLAAACGRMVVLGAPGSGKSTFVRHLALCLAGEAQEPRTRAADLTRLPGWTHGPLTPVYVELRRFVASSHFPGGLDANHPWEAHLWSYIKAEILGEALADYAPQLEYALREGHAILILDGLNEVPYPAGKGNLAKRQQQIRALAASLDVHYPATRIVVVNQLYANENWKLEGYTAVRIVPFDPFKRIALAANLFRVSGYAEPEQKAEQLNVALHQQGVSPVLADNPLFLTLMATLFGRCEPDERLPACKEAMYYQTVLLLLERWTRGKPGLPSFSQLLGNLDREELVARLAELAYEVHSRYGVDLYGVASEIPNGLLSDILFRMELADPTGKAHDLLTSLSHYAGVLVSPGHRHEDYVFRFAHRTFQEYMAALHLVKVCCKQSYAPIREHVLRQPDRWRVPCLLAADVLHDTSDEQNAFAQLRELMEVLLDGDMPPRPLAVSDPHWWLIWLASGIVQEQELYDGTERGSRHEAIKATTIAWLVKLLETAGALPPRERAYCGRTLALVGDPRRGVGIDSKGLPDIEWGDPVLPGDYPVGGDPYAHQSLPAGTVSLFYRYRLSKYPVTYAQFQAFLDAPDGYRDSSRWFEGLAADESDREMREQYFRFSNHPRDSVNWYQAMAFCRWLSWRLGGGYSLDRVLEWEVRLPTQWEWEIAARGKAGLSFPYGDTFDPLKGNTSESGIGQTSAVGLFPNGASPFGVLDMSGNVWEWCLTAYEDGSNAATGNAARVLRGGPWNYTQYVAMAVSRGNYLPNVKYYTVGFRLACRPD